MTSPLSPEAVAQMVADCEAGTPGPFTSKRIDTCTLAISGDGWLDFATVVVKMSGARKDSPDGVANANRIARLPDLEAAYLTLAAENATLRASEAAALERVAAALEIAKTQHIADQPAYSSASDLGWAHQQYASLRRDIIAALTPTADKEPKT